MKKAKLPALDFYRKSNLLALVPLLAVTAVFILPYGAALAGGFSIFSSGESQAAQAAAPAATRELPLLPIALFTVEQAFFSAIAALLLGLPGAWFVGTSDSRLARVLRPLTAVPFAMPSILVALGFVLFFGNAGWFNRFIAALMGNGTERTPILYQTPALVLAHAFYNFPLVIRLVGDSLVHVRHAYAPAAATLGASPWTTARTLFLPAAAPAIMRSALLAFLYSFTSFSIVLALGGGPRATTLGVEIYRYSRILLSFREAGVFAITETLIAALVFVLIVHFERKTQTIFPDNVRRTMEKKPMSLRTSWLLIIYLLTIACIVVGPLLSIVAESFLSRASRSGAAAPSPKWWLAIGERCAPALFRSLALAFCSASASCVLAIIAGWIVKNSEKTASNGAGAVPLLARALRLFVSAPLASSGIVLGLGFLMLYGRKHSANLAAVVAVHAVTALPFAGNAIMEGFHTINSGIINAAESLGASPLKRLFTVDIPLCGRHIRSAFGFAAAISLGELNAVMMLGIEDFETLPLLIYRAAGAYRYGSACAAGVILMLCCALAFAAPDMGVKRDV
ncbi:MAG: iron ABC transporter permease [Treponema sp.]|jgi:thiamine transport system permease protein|nr:iron ABC transporter permease [Treponema sp.]